MINFDIAPLAGLAHTGWTFTTMRQRPVIVRYGALPDTELLVSMYRQLSARTIRLRYGAPRNHVNDEALYTEMSRAVDAGLTNHTSIVVTTGTSAERSAVALMQLVPQPHEPTTAEVALVVRDDYQREGIGRALCRLIGAAAYARGVRRLQFDTLVENRPVMRLIAGLGMRYTADTRRGETRVILALE
ncbi:MAG: GNAT family N-acetyltransferase [Chloroflexi bacterium SZAS-1]|jgi:RimJ/RimL family protein N-acetyltransferase|nr:GNAT family N-acetyltransferase [Chloroflexi bacterium SZAS-1]